MKETLENQPVQSEEPTSSQPDVQPAALGTTSAAPSAGARCSCGHPRSEKDPRRCAMGHQWRETGFGLNHVQAVEGPHHDTPIEQDERLVHYSAVHSHQRAVVGIARLIDRLNARLAMPRLAPKLRDVTEERLLKAEGLRAAAVAEVERLEKAELERGGGVGRVSFGGRYRPDGPRTPGVLSRLSDATLALVLKELNATSIEDIDPTAPLPLKIELTHRAAPADTAGDTPIAQRAGPERQLAPAAPVRVEAVSPEPMVPFTVVPGGKVAPPEDQPYQIDEDGVKTALRPETALGYRFWLPVYNLRDQKGYEWLRALHEQIQHEGREPEATGSRWPTTY